MAERYCGHRLDAHDVPDRRGCIHAGMGASHHGHIRTGGLIIGVGDRFRHSQGFLEAAAHLHGFSRE